MGKQSFVCFLAGEQTVYYVENNRFTHINRFVFPAHGRQGKPAEGSRPQHGAQGARKGKRTYSLQVRVFVR